MNITSLGLSNVCISCRANTLLILFQSFSLFYLSFSNPQGRARNCTGWTTGWPSASSWDLDHTNILSKTCYFLLIWSSSCILFWWRDHRQNSARNGSTTLLAGGHHRVTEPPCSEPWPQHGADRPWSDKPIQLKNLCSLRTVFSRSRPHQQKTLSWQTTSP